MEIDRKAFDVKEMIGVSKIKCLSQEQAYASLICSCTGTIVPNGNHRLTRMDGDLPAPSHVSNSPTQVGLSSHRLLEGPLDG